VIRPSRGALVLIIAVWAVIAVALWGMDDRPAPAPRHVSTTGIAVPVYVPPPLPGLVTGPTTEPPRVTTAVPSRSYRRITPTTTRTIPISRPVVRSKRYSPDWLALKMCESHNNYSENTGNGFYGAYQFLIKTWRDTLTNLHKMHPDLGYEKWINALPNKAPPEVQDAAAQLQFAVNGRSPWPSCGRLL
jgi:hypothetical protein